MANFIKENDFWKEIKSLKVDIKDLYNQVMENSDDLTERLDAITSAVDGNADAGNKLVQRLDALQKRVDGLSKRVNELQSITYGSNDSGAAAALVVGVLGVIGFCILLNEIDILNKKLNELKKQTTACDKPFQPKNKGESDVQ